MIIVDVAEFYEERGGGIKPTSIKNSLNEENTGMNYMSSLRARKMNLKNGTAVRSRGSKACRCLSTKDIACFLYRKKVYIVLYEINPDVVEGSSPWTGMLNIFKPLRVTSLEMARVFP